MSHVHSFKTPEDLRLDESIIRFFEDFYRISDTPGDHDNYVDQFTDDATFIVAHKKNHGHDGGFSWVLLIVSYSTDVNAKYQKS